MATIETLESLGVLRPQMQGVVLLGGVFDIIHGGHINHMQEAKALGKTLIVHVTSDKRVREKKGPDRPILGEEERAKIVAAIRFVDYVFIADAPHHQPEIISVIEPDVLFLNHEAVSSEIRQYLESIKSKIKVVVSSAPKTNNSSQIITKILRAHSQSA